MLQDKLVSKIFKMIVCSMHFLLIQEICLVSDLLSCTILNSIVIIVVVGIVGISVINFVGIGIGISVDNFDGISIVIFVIVSTALFGLHSCRMEPDLAWAPG